MSGQEKEKRGPVTPRMAWINGLSGDMVPSDPGTLSPPECSEERHHFPMAAQGHVPAPNGTQPCHFAWVLWKTSVPSFTFWVTHILTPMSGICNVGIGQEFQGVHF